MPSYAEIMKMTGFKSKNAVYKLVQKLINQGYLDKDSQGRLLPTALTQEVKMLGVVEAGMPTFAEEEVLDTISIEEFLIKKPEETYVLTVKGDSMIEAGIHEGDLVVAERTELAREGDIVIAEVDGGWTMKYFRKKGSQIYLQPANKKYSNIYPEESFKIAAIVKAVIRKYR